MKTPLTFLLSLTFLFLFSGSVYGEEEVKPDYFPPEKYTIMCESGDRFQGIRF